MNCKHRKSSKGRCDLPATGYIIDRNGNKKPLCSGHLLVYIRWGSYQFGPIGNLVQPQPARQGVT